jgi:undecaprenyl diphosphate synthase
MGTFIDDGEILAASEFRRVPRHIGLIPDGNRRWARERGLHPALGYQAGVEKGLEMVEHCRTLGVEEVSVYGFTTDNTKRPVDQRLAFSQACVDFASTVISRGVRLRVVGDASSPVFPQELEPLCRVPQGDGPLKVNMLVNYGWQWDMQMALQAAAKGNGHSKRQITELLASSDVSRIDLIIRWGGCRRLSGFLPIQSVYADFFVIDAYWPDYEPQHMRQALQWYSSQEITLGG